MAEPINHDDARMASHPETAAGAQLVIGTLAGSNDVARTLDDLHLAGFAAGELALVTRIDRTDRAETTDPGRFFRSGESGIVACHGLGTLLIGGGAVPTLRALGVESTLSELGRAFADAGLPDADTLIYELGLIRGQCLLAVLATTAERGQVAYRLLLRGGSREVHSYRSE